MIFFLWLLHVYPNSHIFVLNEKNKKIKTPKLRHANFNLLNDHKIPKFYSRKFLHLKKLYFQMIGVDTEAYMKN